MSEPAVQTFGKYQILERIATGGMAEIYKAKLEGIGGFQRTFAIKRILPNLSQNSEYIAMLVDEAKVAGLLSHANIIQILDLGQVDGIWYIAMEYVSGRDLGAVLRRARKKGLCLPVPHSVFVAIELLKGLEYAHQRQVMRGGRPVALNIIHRDVSPPNVLLSYQGEVKLTDFGIARASLKAMETVSGIVKGRFDYMSPEQAAGAKDLDQRSDLFSVGVVLYEMLTGHHPFRTDNEIGTIEKVRTGRYLPVSQRNPEVPFILETIVDRALQVNRDDRYPSATAFKEALDKFFHDAGFIFTHATLSSYVKGLFPEASAKPGRPGSTPVPTATPTGVHRALRPGGGTQDSTDDATRRVDRRKLNEATPAPAGASGPIPVPTPATGPLRDVDGPTHGPYGASPEGPSGPPSTGRSPVPVARPAPAERPGTPGAAPQGATQVTELGAAPSGRTGPLPAPAPRPGSPGGPQATGPITGHPLGGPPPLDPRAAAGRGPRGGPGLGEDMAPLARKAADGWEDEVATQIRSAASVGLAAYDGPDPETVLRPAKAEPAARPDTTAGRGPVAPEKPARSGIPAWTWAVGAVGLAAGVAIGGVGALVLAVVGLQLGPADAVAPAPADPRVEVVAPAGTQILVDGDAVGKQVTVSPGVDHELTITLQGAPPWKTTFRLGPGETRVFVVEAPALGAGQAPRERGR